jgi:hypothetical protein
MVTALKITGDEIDITKYFQDYPHKLTKSSINNPTH